ncbi:family 2 glycoside hydrolase [Lophiotrema nucula]|uniref:Family 2 glycoside hydrolase n=1 Tax=Lophiotrema nucula TaxID=690887 RepID=A0A6A5ZEI0_9PLEO|nr:family 2 glycoside hydrolase [Lophiotrema nucula]
MGEEYPRPDFVRPNLQWQSLNGQWDFLFDDDDVGLIAKFHQQGLPEQLEVQPRDSDGVATNDSETQSITAKIAANPQNLIQGNFDQKQDGATINHKREINVPYVFQAPASGINERAVHQVLWYERKIEDLRTQQGKDNGDRLLLRFGAVDYEATVWVDGAFAGGHRGGHVPFDLDITDAIETRSEGQHRLTVRVYDSAFDLTQPRGKQYWGAKPESIFYTPSSGIWQTVWLEVVPPARIVDSSHGTILRSDDIDSGILHATVAVLGRRAGHRYSVKVKASYNGVHVHHENLDLPKEGNRVQFDIRLRLEEYERSKISSDDFDDRGHPIFKDRLALWSPEYPQLYDVTIRLYEDPVVSRKLIDEIKTTVGVRSIDWKAGNGSFLLNGVPYFQALNLDQGYWPDTLMTPPSSSALKADIEMAKNMGFNGCRKHQKVEDPVFLYWADKIGYLVWGEMANAYSFSEQYIERFDQEWMEAVKRDINHPSIVAWTPVNESWGYTDLPNNVEQRNHIRSLYYMTKTLDPTRPINDNCGWEHAKTDLTTFHDYADSPELSETCSSLSGILSNKAGRPVFCAFIPAKDEGAAHKDGAVVICTEFGGVNIAPADKQADEWGYTTATDPEDLLQRVDKLVHAVVDGGHCAGFVWTQLTDIEQETNGLYSWDRKAKLDPSKVKAVINGAKKKYHELLEQKP